MHAPQFQGVNMGKARGRRAGGVEGDGIEPVRDYRHDEATRKNNPPAKIAAEGIVPIVPKAIYHYSPRRPPTLQFDPHGDADDLPELVRDALSRPLTENEARLLAEALRDREPWLEWAEKREQHERGFFEVDPVALHIHERISTQAILKVAARQDVQRSLFADPEQEYHEAVQFYKHDIDWTNRLILGDSLQVMSSLARREDLAGKVQMIYIDPPYGIKFASNFQPEVGRRDVKDRDADLTREPEMVKAYRDTWHLGVHSYLSYLRDRLIVAKELLAETGSIFVQISDENLHHIAEMLDEVFQPVNRVSLITFQKTGGQSAKILGTTSDYLLWYAKDRERLKFRRLFQHRPDDDPAAQGFKGAVMVATGLTCPAAEIDASSDKWEVSRKDPITSPGASNSPQEFDFQGKVLLPPSNQHWKTTLEGMERLDKARRVAGKGNSIAYIRYLNDYPVVELTNNWNDTMGARDMAYVVQTAQRVIERCILMTTDPGDLVLDPTCGSGTTAYVAEQWGRRWITIDTSRVAVSLARQRLLTAKYDHYALNDEEEGISGGFNYKTVPHITLRSIAQNENLGPIFEKHEPVLDEKLTACNKALEAVDKKLRDELSAKLLHKQRTEGKRSVTGADERRWKLPKPGGKWEHWEAPFDTDPDWPGKLQEAVTDYRKAWRAKMDEVNACIEKNAEPEVLVDQPEIEKGVVRVSGPFTVEAVQPPEESLGDVVDGFTAPLDGKFDGEPPELEATFGLRYVETRPEREERNLNAYLDQMLRLLRTDGVRFPNNKQMVFSRLDALEAAEPGLHADGRWVPEGEKDDDTEGRAAVCVALGPQYGPVTAKMVEEVIRAANRMGYDDLVVAGFSFDGPAQAVIEEAAHPRLRIHMAHIAPSVNPGMNGLLKEQPGSQLFTVFGQPRTRVDGPDGKGECTVVMEGVDIYNPVENSISSTGAEKVAAWFVDGDYDGRTFCITQAFFPDRAAWSKLSKALKGVLEPDAFEAFSGTVSLPFPAGKHKRVAVKVIDPRGNEVMKVHGL